MALHRLQVSSNARWLSLIAILLAISPAVAQFPDGFTNLQVFPQAFLKTSDALQQQMCESYMDHDFGRFVAHFVVLGPATGPAQPCKGAFDDPAVGQHLKTGAIR
jgi:hypothetical protein